MEYNDVTVTDMRAQGKGRVFVAFDNGVACRLYRTEAGRYALCEGTSLKGERFAQLMSEVAKRAVKRAMHLLEQTDRTERQLRDKLAEGGYPAECIEEAVLYVKRFRYLDDYRYACNYISFAQEKSSRRQIEGKLKQKGISGSLIERALEEEYDSDETEKIKQLLVKRRFEPSCANVKEVQKTYRFLLRKGFRSRDILSAMHTEPDTRYSGSWGEEYSM